MIQSLLIANRGEIACRIIRTARRLGARTVAVYSDADAKALHVRMADEAVHIGPSPATESYLRGERIIAAAKATGAEAIHPGYGFLSENAGFAQAVIDAGLIWVGPKPDSIRAMGLKDAAKKLMAEAGVPVTPGYLGEDQDPKRLAKEADAIGFPILIKAVAGGGGKGMRKVDAAKHFQDALESCKREAASSFGNDVVLLEKWIESPRHIEVQVFGDAHGNVVHLFERDCSLQRRHQKVIEEAPAPGMNGATREAVCGAAVRAAKAVQYEGAGTIEFIADASKGLKADRIWFMEMNTRLQVEHPVTEEITGQDLVEWQLRVASGEPLPKQQDELSITGHAIEARLYAEDPARGFLPSVGTLEHFNLGEDGRIETGVEEGDAISPFYDPMIAKLIAVGENRAEAIGELAAILDESEVWPVRTNAGFLFNALLDADFGKGRIDTGFIERKLDELVPEPEPDEALWRAAAAVATAEDEDDMLAGLAGFRLNGPVEPSTALGRGGTFRRIALDDEQPMAAASGFRDDERVVVFYEGQAYEFERTARGSVHGHGVADGAIVAPMPGKVTSVEVSKGEKVAKGQRLLTLEAMKMEHGLLAPFDGVVAELNTKAGAQVGEGTLLVMVETKEQKMKIEGIAAVVTGGASGLGEATARALAAKGAKVAVFDRDVERGEKVAGEIGGIFSEVDVTSDDKVAAAFAKAREAHGQERVLVNCAGVANAAKTVARDKETKAPKMYPMQQFELVIGINLIGTFRCIAHSAYGMVSADPLEDGERGCIINTASVAAQDGQIGQAAYSASKGGVLAMALPIARDLMNDGVRVNTILPGIFRTPMMAMMPPNVQDALAAQVPFPKRLGTPEEYARLAVFMVENNYINAEAVRLDGGIRMAPR